MVALEVQAKRAGAFRAEACELLLQVLLALLKHLTVLLDLGRLLR